MIAQRVKALITLQGHRFKPLTLAFSPDGRALASGGWGNELHIWGNQDCSRESSMGRGPYATGPHGFRRGLCLQSPMELGASQPAKTALFVSGMSPLEKSASHCKVSLVFRPTAQSAPMTAGLLPPAPAGMCTCGIEMQMNRFSPLKGIKRAPRHARSAPTVTGSFPPARIKPCGCGTRLAANAGVSSKGTRTKYSTAPSAQTEAGSPPPAGIRP